MNYFLQALEISEYVDVKSKNLSGGNKRKTCVAISLLGSPKLIFLDEPTTGVDPLARVYMWNTLKKAMKGEDSSMILTTHYMQEAESMSNKIGILINGQMSTIGSVPYLKKKFGEYTITMRFSEANSDNKESLGAKVLEILPSATKVKGTNKQELSYRVSPDDMRFGDVFRAMNEAKKNNDIEDFSIFTTTLDQIFVRLAKF
mmetsp:Transcript_21427/g.18533  ORF Transcript_21427/g.18533 Transcript_21427/m.18533 type:complete len:202 (+) Transcript_21427:33-638(+)